MNISRSLRASSLPALTMMILLLTPSLVGAIECLTHQVPKTG